MNNNGQVFLDIIVSINGKEIKKIPSEKAIKYNMTIKSIIASVIERSSKILSVPEFFVYVNHKRVTPRDVKDIPIETVKTIDIRDNIRIEENVLCDN